MTATLGAAPRGVRASRSVATARLGLPIGLSAVLHAAVLGAVLFWRPAPPPPAPPVYAVRLEAAPPGERAAGVVTPEPPAPAPAAKAEPAPPTPTPPAPTPPPPRAETRPTDMPMPSAKPVPPARRPAPPATPSLPTPAKPKPATVTRPAAKPGTAAPVKPATDAPRAGGGPTGGRGTDVANVNIRGIAFPFPGYLANIVRQIALQFKPRNPNAPLQADVSFLIRRDGSVGDIRVVKGSGSFAFDLEATGAVEAAGSARSFGPLPAGFRDDVLPVTFSFDPALLR